MAIPADPCPRCKTPADPDGFQPDPGGGRFLYRCRVPGCPRRRWHRNVAGDPVKLAAYQVRAA